MEQQLQTSLGIWGRPIISLLRSRTPMGILIWVTLTSFFRPVSNRYTSLYFTPFYSLSYDFTLILLPTTDTSYLYLDALARYHRILGYDTFFLTGADEHGQKVASSAEKLGREPKVHCDVYVDAFKALCQKLCVKYDVRNHTQLTVYIPFFPLLFWTSLSIIYWYFIYRKYSCTQGLCKNNWCLPQRPSKEVMEKMCRCWWYLFGPLWRLVQWKRRNFYYRDWSSWNRL